MSSNNRSFGDNPFVIILSIIAGLITVFIFLTGHENLPMILEIIRNSTVIPEITEISPTQYMTSLPIPKKPSPTYRPSPTYIPLKISPHNQENILTQISPKDGMVMIYVSAGKFFMGSLDIDNKANDNEKPQHIVYLNAFWMYKTEVTNSIYKKCVDVGKCTPPGEYFYNDLNYANHPVVYIDWNQAETYCKWAGGHLPSEAQWEKAARGIDGRIYPWGNETPNSNQLNYNNIHKGTTEVGSFPSGSSPYGILDMAGNVWEWVWDWYDEDYYVSSPQNNPTGPTIGQYRVYRGGSWEDGSTDVRSTSRYWDNPNGVDFYSSFGGFRCVH